MHGDRETQASLARLAPQEPKHDLREAVLYEFCDGEMVGTSWRGLWERASETHSQEGHDEDSAFHGVGVRGLEPVGGV